MTFYRFTSVSASFDGRFALALTTDGRLLQLEIEGDTVDLEEAVPVVALEGQNIKKIDAGSGHL